LSDVELNIQVGNLYLIRQLDGVLARSAWLIRYPHGVGKAREEYIEFRIVINQLKRRLDGLQIERFGEEVINTRREWIESTRYVDCSSWLN